MRTVSATLATAQAATGRTPYIHLLLTSDDGLTTVDFSTNSVAYGNRILLVDHRESALDDRATIVLRNYDRTLPTSLVGYWTEIGYGDTTGAGNEYPGDGVGSGTKATSRLWVKAQQHITMGGKLLMILELEGMWAKLRETLLRIGSPPYYITDFTTYTVYGLIDYILTNQIDPVMDLLPLVEDDGIIDTYYPPFSVNENKLFEDAGSAIYRLLKMTKSFLRALAGLEWEVIYPQSSDAVDMTYYSAQSPYFYEYTDRDHLALPNHIYLFFNNPTGDPNWPTILTAEAVNTTSQTAYANVAMIAVAPEVILQADGNNRAAAILSRVDAETVAGRLIIPHDCRMELYDRIEIVDTRGT